MLASLSILFVTLIFQLSSVAIKPLVPLLSQSLGLSSLTIGVIVAVQALLPFFLAIPCGQLVDSLGARKILFAGSSIMVLTGFIYYQSEGVILLMLAQMLAGIGQLLVWLAVQTVATQLKRSINDRESYIGYFGSFAGLGQFLAPVLGGLAADLWGYRIAILIFTIIAVFLFIGIYFVPEIKVQAQNRERKPFVDSYSEAWNIFAGSQGVKLTVFASCIPIFVTQIRTSFLPLYLNDLGFSNSILGVIIGMGSLAAIFCRAMMSPMIIRFGRKAVLYMSLVLSFLPMAAVPLFQGFWPLAILSAISGWGGGINEPMSISLLTGYTKSYQRGVAMGLRITGNRAAQFLAPIIFTSFSRINGLSAAFVDFGILLSVWCLSSMVFVNYAGLDKGLGVE